ncbi:C_GCAxxG_C_C family protein [Desulfohalobiaceae bacterium Ax17]|jgi:hypothetical protein|uniref:C-GCAxxG-C-C family protein n=1 Tax=Desulfovulcanus ferrireducens TaxID=2831190 RepID=UPI00207BC597|nr:C-GCAxxG-C-C family protein [Desulfovulcanus ferrireducens]MBT8763055.1 C_GCAxxG_C_C family protein [Desulfovulcanus ferrireducens]
MDRRKFLKNSGKVVGVTLLSTNLMAGSAHAESSKAPKLPFPYSPLDPGKVEKKGYEGYYQHHCSFGAFEAIVGSLREKVGHPYNLIPTEIMTFGRGGVAGWGTICGALNGASAAIALVVGEYKKYKGLLNELLAWYSKVEMPIYIPAGQKDMVKTVAGSPLCHASVMNWCEAANVGAKSKLRSERCARLTADVAKKTAELLNAYFKGTFQYVYYKPTKEELTNYKQNKTKMECSGCH